MGSFGVDICSYAADSSILDGPVTSIDCMRSLDRSMLVGISVSSYR